MTVKNRALRRSLNDFQRHPWLHFVSITTIVVSLSILGTFFLGYRNFEYLAQRSSPHIVGTIYLKDNLSQVEVNALREKMLSFARVQNVTHKTKSSILKELQAFLGGSGTEVMPAEELFPDVMELQLASDSTPSDVTAITQLVTQFPQVAEADFSEDWLAQYTKMKGFLKALGFVLMTFVLVGCTFITANFMGIRHQSRRAEIDVIRLIGGTRRFILAPFLWEGLIEGLVSGVAALCTLYVFKQVISTLLSIQWSYVLGVREWLFLSLGQSIVILALGIVVACLGGITVFLRFDEKSVR